MHLFNGFRRGILFHVACTLSTVTRSPIGNQVMRRRDLRSLVHFLACIPSLLRISAYTWLSYLGLASLHVAGLHCLPR